MQRRSLQVQQMDAKILAFGDIKNQSTPSVGWLKAIRTTLGISLQQLSRRLSITKQSMQEIEQREKEGSITIRSLREAALAMDMQLVYVLVPKDGSLEMLIDRKARELARQIVLRTSNSMKLEDQENSEQRIKKAIEERTALIKNEMPKTLWD